jgi:hypothetical protein
MNPVRGFEWVPFLQQVPEKSMERGLFCCVTGVAEAFFVALGAMAGEAMVLGMGVAGPDAPRLR